jgi:acetyltransferase
MARHPLDVLFKPRSIAVIGASERPGSVGRIVLDNLRQGGFQGPLYVVNPAHKEVLGIASVASARELLAPPDLVIIAVRAAEVPRVLEDCGAVRARAAIVLSVGFAERSVEGAALQAELALIARKYRIRLLGPNCIGFVRPNAHTNAMLGHGFARAGRLALLSQSGAVCNAIMDWASGRGIGFSLAASIGNGADVTFGDALEYLALDYDTSAILVYTEGVVRARRFMSGLRAAARVKPVVVLKAGRELETVRAAATHSASLVGSDAVFESALRRAGAVRATTLEQLFFAAELLSERMRVSGNRLAIVTNAGGIGVMAADRAAQCGLVLSQLQPDTLSKLTQLLPAHWTGTNPVNFYGDASPERYAEALRAIIRDDHVDGAIALVAPLALTKPLEIAHALGTVARETRKPVLASFLGGTQQREARAFLHSTTIPELPGPEAAVEAFGYLASFEHNQRMLLEVPASLADRALPNIERARALVHAALAAGRDSLSLTESKELLRAFNIPVTESRLADSAEAACAAAQQLGLPVALKIASPDISHKSDVDGVRLELYTLNSVREAYAQLQEQAAARRPDARLLGVTVEPMHGKRFGRECLMGIASDPAFGPVITFGAGGTLVELISDRSVALPPLSAAMAEDMIARTRVKSLLGEFRGTAPVATSCLTDVLLALSELACELPEVRELDINPLVADASGVVAVDVRVQLRAAAEATLPGDGEGRYNHCAIEPYPRELVRSVQLRDGQTLRLRPVRPEDAGMEQEFVRKLSTESRYFRFHHGLAELSTTMLIRFTQIDYDNEMAFVATRTDDAGHEEEVASSRYVQEADGETCEFALVVQDGWQGHGLGRLMMQAIIDHARERGLLRMRGDVLFENHKMMRLMQRMGFTSQPHEEDSTLRTVWLKLNDPRPSRLPPHSLRPF